MEGTEKNLERRLRGYKSAWRGVEMLISLPWVAYAVMGSKSDNSELKQKLSTLCGIAALVIGVVGSVVGYSLAHSLNSVTPGSEIRPLNLVFSIVVTAGATTLAGIVLGAACVMFARGARRAWILAILGLIVCFAPWPLSKAEFFHVVDKNHLVLEG